MLTPDFVSCNHSKIVVAHSTQAHGKWGAHYHSHINKQQGETGSSRPHQEPSEAAGMGLPHCHLQSCQRPALVLSSFQDRAGLRLQKEMRDFVLVRVLWL